MTFKKDINTLINPPGPLYTPKCREGLAARATSTLLLLLLFLGLLGSCKNSPVACFTIVTPADSIRVGHVVTFDPSCSSDASQYYWDFGNGVNSTSSTTVQTTYDSIATYTVALVVANSGKSASLTKKVIVLP